MHTDLMIDIETLGKQPGCVITKVGIVAFSPDVPEATPAGRDWSIDIKAQLGRGFHVDGDTLLWWMRQPDDARMDWAGQAAESASVLPSIAIEQMRSWVTANTGLKFSVWANSPQFDLAILAELWRHVGLPLSWEYRQERDMRTLKAICPEVAPVKPTLEHGALSDAYAQAEFVTSALRALKARGAPASTHP